MTYANETPVDGRRRDIMFSVMSVLPVYIGARSAFANGGGGSEERQQREAEAAKKKKPVRKFTQSKFRSLSKNELLELKFGGQGETSVPIQISGFSENMSDWILDMAYAQRAFMRRLIKDMARLKKEKDRKAHLEREMKRIEKLKKVLKASIKRLKAKKGKTVYAALADERSRLYFAKKYKNDLKTWVRHPMEGTY